MTSDPNPLFFVADDGDGETILWRAHEVDDPAPVALVLKFHLDRQDESLWPALLRGLGLDVSGGPRVPAEATEERPAFEHSLPALADYIESGQIGDPPEGASDWDRGHDDGVRRAAALLRNLPERSGPDQAADPADCIGCYRDLVQCLHKWADELASHGAPVSSLAVAEKLRMLLNTVDAEATPARQRPTLADTCTGTDWCPSCELEAGTNRYTDETTGWVCCASCTTALVPIPEESERCTCEYIDIGIGHQRAHPDPECPVHTELHNAVEYYRHVTAGAPSSPLEPQAGDRVIEPARIEHADSLSPIPKHPQTEQPHGGVVNSPCDADTPPPWHGEHPVFVSPGREITDPDEAEALGLTVDARRMREDREPTPEWTPGQRVTATTAVTRREITGSLVDWQKGLSTYIDTGDAFYLVDETTLRPAPDTEETR